MKTLYRTKALKGREGSEGVWLEVREDKGVYSIDQDRVPHRTMDLSMPLSERTTLQEAVAKADKMIADAESRGFKVLE